MSLHRAQTPRGAEECVMDLLIGYIDVPSNLATPTTSTLAHAHRAGTDFALCRMPVVPTDKAWPPPGAGCTECRELAETAQEAG